MFRLSDTPRIHALAAIVLLLAPVDTRAQAPSFETVMRRAHEFVVEYEDDLSKVVAEERYEQRVLNTDGEVEKRRILNSDYRVTQLLPHEFWFGVREVFEVDGRVVRERKTRPIRALRLSPGEDSSERFRRIAENNARFNIGDVTRTFNEPTFVLSFLHPGNRDRMHFVQLGTERVGELSTWVIGYRESPVDGASFIETQGGDHLLTRGRFWIDPTNGRVVRSELITGDARVERTARITVHYRFFPRLDLWLPSQMHEVYEATDAARHPTTITGTATYSNYRIPPPPIASIHVAWDPSLDADVVGYVVEWGETSTQYSDTADVGNATDYKIEGLMEGEIYYIAVRAYTAAGVRSTHSDETSGVAAISGDIGR